jgi:hypothetical protein
MVITVTVLNQKKVPGVGLFTTGRMNYSGAYTAGGESSAGLLAVLKGYNTIDSIQFGTTSGLTAGYDDVSKKVRIWSNVAGTPTELAAGNSPAASSIGFTALSR